MNWLIIRTKFKKEQAVATQISKKGFTVWVPVEKVVQRHPAARRHMDRSNTYLPPKDRPICPSLFFAAVPVDEIDRILGLRDLDKVEQTNEGTWALVPHEQVDRFRKVIDAENAAAMALFQTTGKRNKARWHSMQDALMKLVEGAKQNLEQAA